MEGGRGELRVERHLHTHLEHEWFLRLTEIYRAPLENMMEEKNVLDDLSVGDIVVYINGTSHYEVLAVYEDRAWLKPLSANCSKPSPHTVKMKHLCYLPRKAVCWVAAVRAKNGRIKPHIFNNLPYIGKHGLIGYGADTYEVVGTPTRVEYETAKETSKWP